MYETYPKRYKFTFMVNIIKNLKKKLKASLRQYNNSKFYFLIVIK